MRYGRLPSVALCCTHPKCSATPISSLLPFSPSSSQKNGSLFLKPSKRFPNSPEPLSILPFSGFVLSCRSKNLACITEPQCGCCCSNQIIFSLLTLSDPSNEFVAYQLRTANRCSHQSTRC